MRVGVLSLMALFTRKAKSFIRFATMIQRILLECFYDSFAIYLSSNRFHVFSNETVQ